MTLQAYHESTLLYQPDAGFYTIESGPAALAGDALACETAHAERIVRTLGLYCTTNWQRRAYAGLGPVDIPDEPPGTPPGGPEPPDPYRAPAAPHSPVSLAAPAGTAATTGGAERRAAYLARAERIRAQYESEPARRGRAIWHQGRIVAYRTRAADVYRAHEALGGVR